MHNPKFKLSTICLALLGASFSVSADEAEKKDTNIETITVIGEKIERSLKDTTSSVEVIGENALEDGQFLSFGDAIAEVPNVVVLSGQAPDIRGVSGNGSASGFNSFASGAKPRVTTVIDGVAEPFVADRTGDMGIWDVEQVEVFRGPQSTTNGRNSIGGLVFIKTKDPTQDWEGAARVGYRNQDKFIETSAVISGPILDDQLAFRIAGQRLDGDTFSNLLLSKSPKAPTLNFDPNELKSKRLRAKFLYTPDSIEGFKALLTYSKNREKGDAGRNYYVGEDPFEHDTDSARYIDTNSKTISLKLDHQINNNVSYEVLLSHVAYEWGFDSYPRPITVKMDEKDKTLDAKLNLKNDQGDLSGFVGLYWYKRDQDFMSPKIYDGDDESSSKAIYGEVSYDITDKWNLVVGGRIEREAQLRNFNHQRAKVTFVIDNEKTLFLPKIALTYDISDSTTLGVSARKGYNAGGGTYSFFRKEYYTFEQEKVNTYEFSVRSNLTSDMNLTTNVFYNDYDGYQDDLVGASGNPRDRRIVNIDNANSYGLESALNFSITDNFEVSTGIGLLKTKIEKIDNAYASLKGNELGSAPDLTAKLAMKYWLTDNLHVNFNNHYVGKYYADIKNDKSVESGGYTLSRLTLNWESDNWVVTAFASNLFDVEKRTKKFVQVHPKTKVAKHYSAIVRPRTIGATVTYRF
ncbi:TonB-dependent receptor [Parashewanella tropica]|uniref:TonB-dependent receptor n=1 Tax=Parashewanella tropica TaxID=2547970 RepID=UPI0010599FDD|nr:TonB-dependent receptor [Parashewanella tropica]